MQQLKTLTNEQLVKIWAKYIKEPMPNLRKSLLIRYITWYKQAYENKINPKHFFRRLAQAQKNLEQDTINRPQEKTFPEGACFARSYKGIQYKVEVVSNSYLYNGQTYKSLSAIAREITGKQWNGKVFFGVKNDK